MPEKSEPRDPAFRKGDEPTKMPEKHGTDLAHGIGHKYGTAAEEPAVSQRKEKGAE
jgi:hypothetical protein